MRLQAYSEDHCSFGSYRITTAALVQGRFSTIVNIFTAYVQISDRYISPTVNKTEGLATISDSKWHVQSRESIGWCDKAANEIDSWAR